MKNIFVIGQCSLHWGRMENGNIGNYYITEPFFRELHRVFPDSTIKTTFQMTDEFCSRESVECVPMELYYGWLPTDLSHALEEYGIAKLYSETNVLAKRTPYIDAVLESDLVIDFSGDIWGDNANFVGPDRFMVGLLKDRVAQLLSRPTAMLAGSPGPFAAQESEAFAKEVFENFDLVTNREATSIELLEEWGFNTSKVQSLACPAFLFESRGDDSMQSAYQADGLAYQDKPRVGFILCGWNMIEGPYSKWPREDREFEPFVKAAEHMIRDLGVHVYFMSHSNGFELPPNFKLIHGRDYPFAEQLHRILCERGYSSDVTLIQGLYPPAETKAMIRQFDMLVSGRVHAAVAALSETVPTVIIDYGHEPKAHKLRGFADVANVGDCVADPALEKDLISKIEQVWKSREKIRGDLEQHIPSVRERARKSFDELLKIL